jgi:hypothetical protein
MRSAEFLLLARYIIVMGFLNYQLQNQETPKGQRCAKLLGNVKHFALHLVLKSMVES